MYEDIVKKHFPRGWKYVIKKPHNKAGQFFDIDEGWCKGVADFKKKIIHCVPIIDRYTLLIMLHECGHVNLKHGIDDYQREFAQCEYEAETYAIAALRAENISVPRKYLLTAKEYVDKCIRETPDEPQTDECLKFAYGKKWRNFQ